MIHLFTMRPAVAVILAVISLLTVSTYIASADRQSLQNNYWSGGGVGITSPVAACRDDTSCQLIRGKYPLLYVQFMSSSSLLLAFAENDNLSRSVNGYLLSTISDDAENSKQVAQKAGYSSTVVGFNNKQQPLTEHRVYLEFQTPMKAGHRYSLELPRQTPGTITFLYAEDTVSPSIQVNQVGYLPASRKVAFIGNWLGDAGAMRVSQKIFQVINASTGKQVLEGIAEKTFINDTWSGNNIYQADFSNLQSTGKYYIQVADIGRSDTFEISGDVFADVFRKTFRLFYHSRNSTAIQPPFADNGFERPSGIADRLNGYVYPTILTGVSKSNASAEKYRPIRGGWFDAGDYGQYVVNAAPVWHFFSSGFDINSDALSLDDTRIPESGNRIPDMIDELEWGITWLLAMQDQADGGVFSRLVPLQWDDRLPQEVDSPRYFFEKTTHATASFAAATAIHARLIKHTSPGNSANILKAAESAWEFLQKSPPWPAEGEKYQNAKGVHAGEYSDSSSLDNRLWASAELYRSTGKKKYYDAFSKLFSQIDIDPTAYVSFKEQALAGCWAMLMAMQDGLSVDPDLARQLQDNILSSAEWLVRKSDENPYRAAVHQYKGFTGWGSFAQSTRAVIPLLQAYRLSGNEKYSSRAKEMANPQLGANPLSISYITGVGKRYPRHPLSKLSKFDNLDEPLAGIPVNGPHFHLPELWPSTRMVNTAYYPAEKVKSATDQGSASDEDFSAAYPVLRRYVDSSLLPPMSEPTVSEYAQTAVAYALLAADAK